MPKYFIFGSVLEFHDSFQKTFAVFGSGEWKTGRKNDLQFSALLLGHHLCILEGIKVKTGACRNHPLI